MTSKSVLTSTAGTLVGVFLGIWFERRRRQCWTRLQPPGTEAYEIESHILATQKPAQALGIRVESCTDQKLTLKAPLLLNHNVHGTAFAGSLYSVGVLCSYYLGRAWVLRKGLTKYELVAKAGSIQYQRPVTTTHIVAQSVLPSEEMLERFREELVSKGKATVGIDGCVLLSGGKVACEYTVDVCAFLPRTTV